MIITSSGFSTFPPIVLASRDSLSGCGNGFARLRLNGLQPQGFCDVVLPGTCPKRYQSNYRRPFFVPVFQDLGKKSPSSPCPSYA